MLPIIHPERPSLFCHPERSEESRKYKVGVTEMLRHYVPLHEKLDECILHHLSSSALRRTNDCMFIDAPQDVSRQTIGSSGYNLWFVCCWERLFPEVYLYVVTVTASFNDTMFLPEITDIAFGCGWIHTNFFSSLLGFTRFVFVGKCLEESQLFR